MHIFENTGDLSLADASSNTSGIIVAITGNDIFLRKVVGYGLTLGAHISILQNYGIGPVIVHLRDSQIAFGRAEAQKIIICK